MYLIPEIELVPLSHGSWVMVNLINGNADLLDDDTCKAVLSEDANSLESDQIQLLKDRKYFFDCKEDYQKYIKYLNGELLTQSKSEPPNFVYIPTYTCNLNCYYCFEKAYEKTLSKNRFESSEERAEAFFEFIEKMIERLESVQDCGKAHDEIEVAITGGEPLQEGFEKEIRLILEGCCRRGYSSAIVSNGVEIDRYLPMIQQYGVSRVQVTLDGPKEIHDGIRIAKKDGGPTYDLVSHAIEVLTSVGIETWVRINVTKRNINFISELAEIIEENHKANFYVYLLQQEGCAGYDGIIDELTGLRRLVEMKAGDARLRNLLIDYHGRALVEGIFGERPFRPKVKICTAMQNQYIFDYVGNIFKCWWGMGNKSYVVGTCEGCSASIDDNLCKKYYDRNIVKLDKCSVCKYRYVCGGGCTGRMTRKDMEAGSTNCPDFHRIIQYMIKYNLEVDTES